MKKQCVLCDVVEMNFSSAVRFAVASSVCINIGTVWVEVGGPSEATRRHIPEIGRLSV